MFFQEMLKMGFVTDPRARRTYRWTDEQMYAFQDKQFMRLEGRYPPLVLIPIIKMYNLLIDPVAVSKYNGLKGTFSVLPELGDPREAIILIQMDNNYMLTPEDERAAERLLKQIMEEGLPLEYVE
jgi:hypothetical protein